MTDDDTKAGAYNPARVAGALGQTFTLTANTASGGWGTSGTAAQIAEALERLRPGETATITVTASQTVYGGSISAGNGGHYAAKKEPISE